MADWIIRPFTADDSVDELTRLINRAYAEHIPHGYNPTGSYQNADDTRVRLARGTCFVAVLGNKLVGSAVRHEYRKEFDDELVNDLLGAAVLGQFAVDPDLRKLGIGAALINAVEEEAKTLGYDRLALDTIETATDLVEYYKRRGFEPVGHVQWPGKTYRSLVMCKPLI